MAQLRRRGLVPLIAISLATLLVVGMSATASAASLIGDWRLKGNFKNAAGTNAKLEAVGSPEFDVRNVGGSVRKALVFDEGEGAALKRVPASARGSYSIQIYFEFDTLTNYRRIMSWGSSLEDPALYTLNGKLYLYDYVEDEVATIDPNEWNRLLVTYDGRNGLTLVYVNGRLRIAHIDRAGDFFLKDGRATFFKDDGGENASGTVAQIRLWRGVVVP
jgi:hypothetical protein